MNKTYEELRNEAAGYAMSAIMLELYHRSEGLPEKRKLIMEATHHVGFGQQYVLRMTELIDKILLELDTKFLLKASGVGYKADDSAGRIEAGLNK